MTKKKPLEFVIVMPTYNNEYWCARSLESIASQTYPHWSLCCIDDASSDGTRALVRHLTRRGPFRGRTTIVSRRTRRGSLANISDAVGHIDAEKVVVMLDGDDALAHPHVLEKLASVYQDPDVWLTYGSFQTDPPSPRIRCRPYSKTVCKRALFRSEPFLATHLKTFYAKLFHMIPLEALSWKGQFFPVLGDMAFMFPMLEMAREKHIRFVKEILYIYNAANPLSDYRVNAELCSVIETYLRTRAPSRAIRSLF